MLSSCCFSSIVTVKTGIQKACGDTDIGGAYVGKDGYDFEKITPEDVDEKQVDRNIKAVEDYFMMASETIDKQKLSFLLVPTSGYCPTKVPVSPPDIGSHSAKIHDL